MPSTKFSDCRDAYCWPPAAGSLVGNRGTKGRERFSYISRGFESNFCGDPVFASIFFESCVAFAFGLQHWMSRGSVVFVPS